jgi:hypothetical protein
VRGEESTRQTRQPRQYERPALFMAASFHTQTEIYVPHTIYCCCVYTVFSPHYHIHQVSPRKSFSLYFRCDITWRIHWCLVGFESSPPRTGDPRSYTNTTKEKLVSTIHLYRTKKNTFIYRRLLIWALQNNNAMITITRYEKDIDNQFFCFFFARRVKYWAQRR